jgi:hypothetical protein
MCKITTKRSPGRPPRATVRMENAFIAILRPSTAFIKKRRIIAPTECIRSIARDLRSLKSKYKITSEIKIAPISKRNEISDM